MRPRGRSDSVAYCSLCRPGWPGYLPSGRNLPAIAELNLPGSAQRLLLLMHAGSFPGEVNMSLSRQLGALLMSAMLAATALAQEETEQAPPPREGRPERGEARQQM